jgi:hypothetical protein
MSRYTNPLDNIQIASPCPADWNQMFGDERKRFCGDCKLNVYNLSDMTRHEAENLIMSSEGRLCVRFFRRADGTIITKNCPVGWAAVKRRAARVATAVFSVIAGFITGIFGYTMLKKETPQHTMGDITIQGKMPIYETTGAIAVRPTPKTPAMGTMKMGEVGSPRTNMDTDQSIYTVPPATKRL